MSTPGGGTLRPFHASHAESDVVVVDATFIEPDDDQAVCRWAALRNQAHGLHIVATVIR
ncbi:hypothetical protein AB0F07_24745 [Streptomyces fructofermentans]|uniref:hypothetical protein n=1 Tax=Streptomyces fructofermentans TaxID=152141 RepID=UPI0033F6A8D9